MPISNQKKPKGQGSKDGRGLGPCRRGGQGDRSGNKTTGKKRRQQTRCGLPHRNDTEATEGNSSSWKKVDGAGDLEEIPVGVGPQQPEGGVGSRGQRRRR